MSIAYRTVRRKQTGAVIRRGSPGKRENATLRSVK
jgi:hypothetical protein